LVEETRVPGEKHRPVASHWQALSHNAERKRTNNDLQNTTQKTKIEQYEPHLKQEVNAGAPEWYAVPASLVALENVSLTGLYLYCSSFNVSTVRFTQHSGF
jgi:hypothetical protein